MMPSCPVPGRWVLDELAAELGNVSPELWPEPGRDLQLPPDDLPGEPAVIRSDGALRRWSGYLWRWDERRGWRYVRPL